VVAWYTDTNHYPHSSFLALSGLLLPTQKGKHRVPEKKLRIRDAYLQPEQNPRLRAKLC
jgi:hypothetical protein